MYHTVGIEKLSENQLSRLRNGHPVRLKLGNHHNIHLSIQQLKKLNSASKRGKASTVTFDPYQKEAHGSGVFGDICKKCKGKGCGEGLVSDVLLTSGNVTKTIGLGVARKHVVEKKRRTRKFKGRGFLGDLGNIAKTGALNIAQQGIDAGASYLNNKVSGMGVVQKTRRIVGRRVVQKKKTHGGSGEGCSGGALFPAGISAGSALFPSE
jgi:hypothetical protein